MFFIWVFLGRKAKAMREWPSVPGRVLSSALVRNERDDQPYQLEARVAYSYSVAGTVLNGHRIALAGSGRRGAKAAVEYYRPGNEVEVFYDPKAPSSSVLEKQLSRNALVLPLGAIVFVLVGVVLLAV
jgi:hypothetical protein